MSGDELVILTSVLLTILVFVLGRNEDGFVWWKALAIGVLSLVFTFLTGYLAAFLGAAMGMFGAILAMVVLAALVAVSIRFVIKMKWKESVTLGVVYVILGGVLSFASQIHVG